jgi:hypothetical protein
MMGNGVPYLEFETGVPGPMDRREHKNDLKMCKHFKPNILI